MVSAHSPGAALGDLKERLSEKRSWRYRGDLGRRFVGECRRTRTAFPATPTIERLCADALVDAERRIEAALSEIRTELKTSSSTPSQDE
jgi:hypothetical protein